VYAYGYAHMQIRC